MLQMSSCFKKAYIVQTSEMSYELVESAVKGDKTCNNWILSIDVLTHILLLLTNCQVYPCICSMSNWNISVALFKACMRNYAQYCNIPAWVDTMQSVEVIVGACICHYRLSQLVGAFCSISKWNKIATLFCACEATTRLLSWQGIVCPYVITIIVIITHAVLLTVAASV